MILTNYEHLEIFLLFLDKKFLRDVSIASNILIYYVKLKHFPNIICRRLRKKKKKKTKVTSNFCITRYR
jgi:hypothetical protein